MSKVAVVTGANKGLGYEIVRQLCQFFIGTVYLTSRDEARGLEAVEQLKKLGLNPSYHQLDVTDATSVKRFCEYIKEKHGKIKILVNNAGILFLKDAQESKIYQAEQTLAVNFFSLVDFTEEILPLFTDGGSIVNISSSSGHLSRIPSNELKAKISRKLMPLEELKALMNEYLNAVRQGRDEEDGWGSSPYVVSKVGVNAYTLLLHHRLIGTGISVSSVHPGYVQSDMTRGVGTIVPAEAARLPASVAMAPRTAQLLWHNGAAVPWGGPDPRGYIDGLDVGVVPLQ